MLFIHSTSAINHSERWQPYSSLCISNIPECARCYRQPLVTRLLAAQSASAYKRNHSIFRDCGNFSNTSAGAPSRSEYRHDARQCWCFSVALLAINLTQSKLFRDAEIVNVPFLVVLGGCSARRVECRVAGHTNATQRRSAPKPSEPIVQVNDEQHLSHTSAIVSLQRFLNIHVKIVIMTRLTRKIVSLFSIVAMVFAQLAVAAYACPMQFQGLDNSVATVTATAAEPDAGDYDTSAPALCKKHCEDGQQNVNDAPQTHAFLSFESALTLTMAIQPATSRDAPVATPSLQNATAPPHSIRNCCFRI